MTELDNTTLRLSLDPEGAYERNINMPAQCREAWETVRGFSLPPEYHNPAQVIVAGMGGSAIAGDFLQALCYSDSTTPVTVLRGYELPRWANQDTLVIACSHSGNTEESLTDFHQARERGCKVVVVTTGGELGRLAGEAGLPSLVYDFYHEPRSAFGHSFLRLLAIARAAGFLPLTDAQVEAAIAETEALQTNLSEETPESANLAKGLARRMHDKLPVIVGAEFLSPVARRWKTQINENSDSWAVDDHLPEMHHNTVVGLNLPASVAANIHVVLLQHAGLHERVRLRCDISAELFDRVGLSYERLDLPGNDALSAMLAAVYLGSMVSFYLAMLNGVHPSEIDNINYLKGRLD